MARLYTTQLIYALESDSASLGRAYYAIKEMAELVAGALDNVATAEYAAQFQVHYVSSCDPYLLFAACYSGSLASLT